MRKLNGIWMAAAVAGAFIFGASLNPLHAAGIAAIGSPASSSMPASYLQERGWDEPPREFDEVSRRGFHDGIEGARKDWDNHRRPDVNNRDEFRHPHVPDRDREAYRHGFERGYQVGVDHLYHGR